MKYAIWGFLTILVCPFSAHAEDQVQIPWANKFFVPKDAPPVVVHDFGTVPWGTTLTHRFNFTNIYAVQMQIMKEPDVSCGCVKIVKYSQKLEPRETGYIEIEMDGRRFQGAKAVTIQVRFGPKFQSTALLQVRAFGRTDVTLNPGQVSFNRVALGQSPAKEIDIQYTGNVPNWQIMEVDTLNAPNVKATLSKLTMQKGIGYRVSVSLKPDAAVGNLQEQLLLKTNDPASPILSVPVTGTVVAPLSVVQGAQVKLDPIPVGQEVVRNIMVRGEKAFQITKIEGEGDGLKVTYRPIPESVQFVTITFKPTQAGVLSRKLTIFTNQNESTTVMIEGSATSPVDP